MAVLKYSKVLLLVLLIATGLSCIGIYWLGKEQNRLLNEQCHALNIRIINDLGTKLMPLAVRKIRVSLIPSAR